MLKARLYNYELEKEKESLGEKIKKRYWVGSSN